MITLVSLAFAIDFTPTWTADTREPDDPIQEMTERTLPPFTGTPTRTPLVSFDDVSEPRHPWLDESTLTLAIAGDWGRRYYVVATAIAAGTVTHWQQGPYDTPDSTLPVVIELPLDVQQAVQKESAGYLTVSVMSTDFASEAIRREPPTPATRLSVQGAIVVGLPRGSRSSTLTTSEDW